jgi:hypothetical protein
MNKVEKAVKAAVSLCSQGLMQVIQESGCQCAVLLNPATGENTWRRNPQCPVHQKVGMPGALTSPRGDGRQRWDDKARPENDVDISAILSVVQAQVAADVGAAIEAYDKDLAERIDEVITFHVKAALAAQHQTQVFDITGPVYGTSNTGTVTGIVNTQDQH